MTLLITATILMALGAILACLGVRSEWDGTSTAVSNTACFAGIALGCLGFGVLVVDMVGRVV